MFTYEQKQLDTLPDTTENHQIWCLWSVKMKVFGAVFPTSHAPCPQRVVTSIDGLQQISQTLIQEDIGEQSLNDDQIDLF